MNASDLLALSPLLLIAATAVVVMLGIAFRRNHALAARLDTRRTDSRFRLHRCRRAAAFPGK